MSNLKIEARVSNNSPVVNKRIEEINQDYCVKISAIRMISEGVMERENPSKDSVVKENNYVEFSGEPDKVMKLFMDCEKD